MEGEGRVMTNSTETADAALERCGGGRFDRAVLYGLAFNSISYFLSLSLLLEPRGKFKLTLHTILPQLRHSPTISRAHLPTLPRVMRPEPALPWLKRRKTDLTLVGMAAPASSISSTVSMYSFSQRRVSRTSWCRNGARLRWNWRHVRDKAWRVFRSTARAISLTTLDKSRIC